MGFNMKSGEASSYPLPLTYIMLGVSVLFSAGSTGFLAYFTYYLNMDHMSVPWEFIIVSPLQQAKVAWPGPADHLTIPSIAPSNFVIHVTCQSHGAIRTLAPARGDSSRSEAFRHLSWPPARTLGGRYRLARPQNWAHGSVAFMQHDGLADQRGNDGVSHLQGDVCFPLAVRGSRTGYVGLGHQGVAERWRKQGRSC